MPSAMCAICGGRPSRRIDLTESEVNPNDVSDYEVRGLLRGVLICDECASRKAINGLLNLRGNVQLIRGCMVQCADRPPRHLRWVRPRGSRMWSKTICPCCHGRATVQIIADVVERPESALWRGLKDAFGLLSLRRQDDDYELEEAEETPQIAAIESGGADETSGGSVMPGYRGSGV